MKFHPIANIFPLMTETEISSLADDISKNGLIEPIITHEGTILDGRNRYLACQKANVEPNYVPFSSRDPLSFVISLNLKRRHLNESQRAMVAAKLANIEREDTLKQGSRSANLPIGKISQTQAAKLLNVSDRSIRDAKSILKDAPEKVKAIEYGERTVHQVKRDIRKEEDAKKREVAIKEGKKIKEETVLHLPIEQVQLEPNSVDLIVTDPPYDDQHIEHYAMAAKLAESILKPGRFFCCYAGKLRLPDVINAVTPYLDWIWEVCAFHPFSKEKHLGSPYQFAENWRPVLIFKKVGKAPICNFQQDVVRAERDKTFHDWQQDLKTPLQLIEAYTEPGELVVDFFCGGGTTLVAAKQSGRRWLGFDISEESVALSKRRLYGEN